MILRANDKIEVFFKYLLPNTVSPIHAQFIY